MTDDELEHRVIAIEQEIAKWRADWLTLHDQMVSMLGRSAGLRAGWLYLLGAISAMGTAVSIVHILNT